MCLDLLKVSSDDAYFTEDHCVFLLNKFRALLLKQQYLDKNKEIPDSNVQVLCIDLERKDAIDGYPCEGEYLKSTDKIPESLGVTPLKVTSIDLFGNSITYVNNERFKYVGHNKWLKNFIYATIGPDNYLYIKSENPQAYYLEKVKVSGVFEDVEEADKFSCDKDSKETCDIMDKEFHIEDALIPSLIELVVKELSSGLYKPEDSYNNASDDASNLYTFIARNVKDEIQKQIDGDN